MWCAEYWQHDLALDGVCLQGGIGPRTKEEKYRCTIRQMRLATMTVLVIDVVGILGVLGGSLLPS